MGMQGPDSFPAGDGGRGADRVRAVFEVSYRRLVGQLYGVCGDLTEAEEVVAEAFARAVQHQRVFHQFAPKPAGWQAGQPLPS